MKPSDRFDSLVQYYCERALLPWEIVKRQMLAESSGNPRAKSSAGALGLLQLMPGTAAELGCTDPMNPDENIKAGTEYLARIFYDLKAKFGPEKATENDWMRFALAGYNCGPGYIRSAVRSVLAESSTVTWAVLGRVLPNVEIHGRRPRASEPIAYVQRIMPPES